MSFSGFYFLSFSGFYFLSFSGLTRESKKYILINMKRMYVYIMTNQNNVPIYTGVTNDLIRRIYEHKNHLSGGFTAKYNIDKLVYYEIYEDEITAIQREKNLKHYKREWKIALIDKFNPQWSDLYSEICK